MLALFGGAPGPMELLIILIVILLLFGAKRLPELSHSLGKSLSEFKKGKEEGAKALKDVVEESAATTDDPQKTAEAKNVTAESSKESGKKA